LANRRNPSRGQRDIASFRRRAPQREPRELVLIVCEGEKTEPVYFEALRKHKRLSNVEVEIHGEECGSHPLCVVDYAVEHIKKQNRTERYDAVWCVFDRDEHPNIHEAMDRAKAHKFQVAFSNPCFELWYLLHFTKHSTAYLHRDRVTSRLSKLIEGYDKWLDVYHLLLSRQGAALLNAELLVQHHTPDGISVECNPCTMVHELVRYLNGIAER